MSFSRLIYRLVDPVADFRIDVPLIVLGARGALVHPFRLDTGCGITVVSERIARVFGLPNGGRPLRSPHVLTGSGRVVPARFRFPSDVTTGASGREVASEWLVIPVTYEYARLGFRDVHPHFTVTTDDTFMHFADR